ncbi:MAG: L-threonylcarbamoyladenylate synthase [Thermodesulfobacteriota bacterium]
MVRNKIVPVDPQNPDPILIKDAADLLRSGGVVVFPTRCLYGLAVDALLPAAVDTIFRIKKRPASNPVLILIPHSDFLKDLVLDIPETASRIMERFWPGQVTIVFQATKAVSPLLTAGTGKIGIRMPDHPVAAALVKTMNSPITGTSANLSSRESCAAVKELDPSLAAEVDLILDAGQLMGGAGSTVVDVTVNPPVILRQGMLTNQSFVL